MPRRNTITRTAEQRRPADYPRCPLCGSTSPTRPCQHRQTDDSQLELLPVDAA